MASTVVAGPAVTPDKGLRAGALGLISSVVIAVSSTAPAYSMAATLGLVVAIVGVHSPGTLVVSFLPMLCIAFAFRELNQADPDCGITFTWAARAFGPRTGWMGGWGIIAADVIVMASLSQIAGRYVFLLFGVAASTLRVTAAGVAFIALLTWVCYRGIEVSARLQQVLLAIEVIALTVFAVTALVKAGTGHALPGHAHPSLTWLNPWTGSFSSLSDSFLLAVFIYWGWDCALSVNEETRDSARTPGRAAVIATVLLVAIFAAVSTAALAYAGPAFLADHSNRRTLLTSVRDLVTKGILPLLGGLVLLGAFVLSIKSYWPASSSASSFHGVGGIFLIGAGSLVLGVIIMLITSRFLPRFFSRAGGSR
jgi:amino acid transporter